LASKWRQGPDHGFFLGFGQGTARAILQAGDPVRLARRFCNAPFGRLIGDSCARRFGVMALLRRGALALFLLFRWIRGCC
jgi:hypothetical protein